MNKKVQVFLLDNLGFVHPYIFMGFLSAVASINRMFGVATLKKMLRIPFRLFVMLTEFDIFRSKTKRYE